MDWNLERRRHSYIWQSGYLAAFGITSGIDLGAQDGYGTKMLGNGFVGYDSHPQTTAVKRFDVEKNDWKRLGTPPRAIIANHLIEHLNDPGKFVDNAMSTLTPQRAAGILPGGVFICVTPNKTLRLAKGETPWNHEHTVEFSAAEFRRLFPGRAVLYGLYGSPAIMEWEKKRIGGGGSIRRLVREHPWLFAPIRPVWRLLFSPKQDKAPFVVAPCSSRGDEPLDLIMVCWK